MQARDRSVHHDCMSRLKRYRELMLSLDPSAEPLIAVKNGWGVDRPASAIAEKIAQRLELEPWSFHLLIGGIGSGKTTELQRLRLRLRQASEESGDVTQYLDVAKWTRLDRLGPGVLVSIVGMRLAELETKLRTARGGGQRPTVVADARLAVQRLARGYAYAASVEDDEDEDEDHDGDHDEDPVELIEVPGVLDPPERPIEQRVAEVIGPLRTLRSAITQGDGHCVFLIDSLDRAPEFGDLERALSDDIRALKRAGLGGAVVAPLRLRYRAPPSFTELFEHNVHSLAEVEPAGPGLDFLVEVLSRRTKAEMVPQESRIELARASGGVLRDLISLAKTAAQEAYVGGADHIDIDHVLRAVDHHGRTLAVGLDGEQIKILKAVRERGTMVIRGERELVLLETRRVLDYGNGRFGVHPTLVRLLDLMTVAA